MIICGFAGTGKSTAAKKISGVIDLESTPFQKDWDTYARVAKHMSDQGYYVLLSCHKELREKLHELGYDYIVVYPEKNQKNIYRQRYVERGNTPEFIAMQMSHWDDWVGRSLSWEGWDDDVKCETYEVEHVVYLDTTPSGHVETMSDLLDDLIRYGQKVMDLFPPEFED
jgi:adenylate kinase family enzyme